MATTTALSSESGTLPRSRDAEWRVPTRLRHSRPKAHVTAALVTLAMLGASDVLPARDRDAAARKKDEAKQVLVLYSTSRDPVLAGARDRELSRLLNKGLSQPLDYYTEYIDLTRFPDEQYQAGFRNFLRLKYRNVRFDVVIAVEEASLEFVEKARKELFPDTPVVFFALYPVTRRPPNSTGVYAEPDFGGTIGLARALQPDIEQVLVVSGASARDRLFEDLARRRLELLDEHLTITYLSGLPIDRLEAIVSELPSHSVIYYLLMSQDGSGVHLLPMEYLDRLASVANRPIYSWDDSTMGHGVVGGCLRHFESGIALLAQQALSVLEGHSADTLPTLTPDLNVAQVDWRQLQRWNIPERLVPAGTTVRFRELTFWSRYKRSVISALAILVAQTGLILALLIQRARRRRAEDRVRGSQAELQTSYERIRDLGARLLSAQDVERSRIARDLHDDVSQQLALLSIDLQLLSGVAQARSEDPRELARVALERTHGIARSVHNLSHRLHPAKLRLIGLVAGLNGLLREISHPDIEATVGLNNVPVTLSQELTLCVYRVVQEALQNAVKHSAAGRISVQLMQRDEGLTLTIEDDGVGFELSTAWTKGLGLISMRERLEAIGGKLIIDARPGAGTRLEVTVPLRQDQPVETVA